MKSHENALYNLYPIADVCRSHTTFDSAGRNVSFPYQGFCDHTLATEWYRLTGDAGSYLPESCPQPQTHVCGTSYPGWLNGIHPTTAEGVVTRTACFSSSAGCCTYSTSIKVKNCGDFYVYEFAPVPTCSLRYCVTNEGEYVSNSCTYSFFFYSHCSHCFQNDYSTLSKLVPTSWYVSAPWSFPVFSFFFTGRSTY